MDKEPAFQKGEKVVEDIYNKEGIIKEITLRDSSYKYRYKYLVEFKKKSFWGKEKIYREWYISYSLRKFITAP